MARWVTHRTDNGSKALIRYAENVGFVYVALDGALDGLLIWGQIVTIVDWKSKGGELTATQQRLIAKGVPIRFISQPSQIEALKTELLRVA